MASAVAWLACTVRSVGVGGVDRAVPPASHVLFVGEVVDAGESRGAASGDPGPLVLRMEDTRMHYGG